MISVLGIGENGLDGLTPKAQDILNHADVLVGGERHLRFAPAFQGETLDWSGGIDATLDAMGDKLHLNIVVLASGDPLYFGVAKNIIARFGAARVQVLPVPGAVSLTCAAMGWSQADVHVVTVHGRGQGRGQGRALESLNLYLTPGARLVVLSKDADTPAQTAKLLTAQGYGQSVIWVLEHLGGPKEDRMQGIAANWAHPAEADLNTLAIELIGDDTAQPLSRLAGLPDEAYEHDGQLTKRATRAVTLSSLAPLPGELLWDFGAGAASISIEWMRTHPSCHAVAIEHDTVRAARIHTNAKNLGVPKLTIEESENLAALDKLSGAPDAIFIGGGLALDLVEAAWDRLKPGGRLVVNAVTDKSRKILKTLRKKYGGDLMTITIEGKLPITQYKTEKKT
ncbi:MAG: precorrin-6y C5,15-methyltransferase (decarboxylating) subunit CbiE [Magnetovibrio sp.]|nr:precorrin-6y C5,15-methyltransferase (decarboxylating) subunit CbiE [Magnetovibrio sp.]